MRRAAAALAFLVIATAPQPALACRPPYYSEDIYSFPRADFAAVLVENATYIDLAVAERAEPLTELDGWVKQALDAGLAETEGAADRASTRRYYRGLAGDLRRQGASRIVFRSLEKLRGDGQSWFTLNGLWRPRDEPQHGIGERLADALTPRSVWYAMGGPYEILQNQFPLLCSRPVTVRPGQRYLVFRDLDGRLMGPSIPLLTRDTGEIGLRLGYVFQPVAANGDPWLDLVRQKASVLP